MNTTNKTELERIVNNGGFHAKVAQTVLSTGQMSLKQQMILNEVSEFWFDCNEFEIDVTNLRHDQKFEDMQNESRNQQMKSL